MGSLPVLPLGLDVALNLLAVLNSDYLVVSTTDIMVNNFN